MRALQAPKLTFWRTPGGLDIQRLAELCFVFPPDGRTSAQHLLEAVREASPLCVIICCLQD